MRISRDIHLSRLSGSRHNGLIKVITGMRRCGKSYLLNELFKDYLLSDGVEADHIIQVAFDIRRNKPLRNPDTLCDYVENKARNSGKYYVLLDEIQMVDDFEQENNSYGRRNKNLA